MSSPMTCCSMRPERRILQDVVTCIREGCAIDDAGFRRNRFADRHLKAPEEMERLFARHKAAVARSMEIVRRCTFSVAELATEYQYPHEVVIPGLDRAAGSGEADLGSGGGALSRWCQAGDDRPAAQGIAADRRDGLRALFPHRARHRAACALAETFSARVAARQPIPPSATCSSITAIDPVESKLLFERFVSKDRNEPPDIDVDFEHERREEVIQWIYKEYGRERGGAVRHRGALPHPPRGARGRQGDGAVGGRHRPDGQPGVGLVDGGRHREGDQRAQPQSAGIAGWL